MSLTVGSLFSGIGGLDLGLERAGMEVIWQSEIDPYACRVLSKHWKEVPNHGNIKEINWGDIVQPDIICGGYPCQPFSTAGKRNGTDDPRHLWPWVREAISILRPRYAILENVRGHVSLGLDVVLREMASIGYDAEWQIVSAASVGAPHRRDRVIIIAYPIRELADTNSQRHIHGQSKVFTAERWLNALSLIGTSSSDVADTNSTPRQPKQEWQISQSDTERCSWWATEPNVGRVANGVSSRVDRLRGIGNSVVPQVAELVGRIVIDFENSQTRLGLVETE
jgi:DNA (cytosine-5)-methyltransferase 1